MRYFTVFDTPYTLAVSMTNLLRVFLCMFQVEKTTGNSLPMSLIIETVSKLLGLPQSLCCWSLHPEPAVANIFLMRSFNAEFTQLSLSLVKTISLNKHIPEPQSHLADNTNTTRTRFLKINTRHFTYYI